MRRSEFKPNLDRSVINLAEAQVLRLNLRSIVAAAAAEMWQEAAPVQQMPS